VRKKDVFQVKSDRINQLGIAFVPPKGVNLSGGLLSIRYLCSEPMDPAIVELKPPANSSAATNLIPNELFTRFNNTNGREEEIHIPLPATPGLTQIKEVVITYGQEKERPIDLSITQLRFTPLNE
jgi:hypothetical protein